MLKILHKGIQYNARLNSTDLTGNAIEDAKLPYITSLVGGKVAALGENGVELADGATGNARGFIINDAAGEAYGNKAELASGILPITHGNCVAITDQIVEGINIKAGDKLWVGTGADKGLLTNVDPVTEGSAHFGIADSDAGPTNKEVTVLV